MAPSLPLRKGAKFWHLRFGLIKSKTSVPAKNSELLVVSAMPVVTRTFVSKVEKKSQKVTILHAKRFYMWGQVALVPIGKSQIR